MARLPASHRSQQIFSERLNERVELLGFGVWFDDIDTSTEHGMHVDVLYPPLMKAFIDPPMSRTSAMAATASRRVPIAGGCGSS